MLEANGALLLNKCGRHRVVHLQVDFPRVTRRPVDDTLVAVSGAIRNRCAKVAQPPLHVLTRSDLLRLLQARGLACTLTAAHLLDIHLTSWL